MSRIPDALDKIDEEITQCEERLAFLKKRIDEVVEETLLAIPDKEQRELTAKDIYWFLPRTNAVKIKKIIGTDILPIALMAHCEKCGKYVEPAIKSRKEKKEYSDKKSPKAVVCDSCVQKDKQESTLRWEARKAEMAAYLEELRTMPYAQYLQTEHWQKVRKSALGRARYKCQLCKKDGELNVHHNTYENRGQEQNSDVIVLCRNCHAHFHGK